MEYLADPTYFERTSTDFFGCTPRKQKTIDLAMQQLERLFPAQGEGKDINDNEENMPETLSMQEELEKAIQSVGKEVLAEKNPTKKLLKKEFELYAASSVKPPNLEALSQALNSVQPTSVEAERAFSACGLFLTKMRSRLSDSTINALCFLRAHFQAAK